jgi:hypothetical protein
MENNAVSADEKKPERNSRMSSMMAWVIILRETRCHCFGSSSPWARGVVRQQVDSLSGIARGSATVDGPGSE